LEEIKVKEEEVEIEIPEDYSDSHTSPDDLKAEDDEIAESLLPVEIVPWDFLQVPGTPCTRPSPPRRCVFFGKKRGGTWVPPQSLKNACQVG
jgi:hypothetical protein